MYKKKLLLFGFLVVLLSPLFVTSVSAGFVGGGGGGNPVKKFGFFFWTSYDVGNQECIDAYESVLQSKGYTTYEIKDLKWGGVQKTFSEVVDIIDGIEDSNDILFFYFAGHGYYNSYQDYSEVYVTPNLTLLSPELKNKCNLFEATDVSIFVQACHAGDFVDEFADKDGYLVMTTSGEGDLSWHWLDGTPLFSNTFWTDLAVYPQHSAIDAFYNAKLVHSVVPWWHYPQIVDNSDYDFF